MFDLIFCQYYGILDFLKSNFQSTIPSRTLREAWESSLPTKSILFRNSDIFPGTEYEVLSDILDMIYRRRPYFRTHLYAILGQLKTIFPYFRTLMWKKQ